MEGRVLVELNLLDLELRPLVVSNSCEAYRVVLSEQGGSGLLDAFSVDLSLVDRGGRSIKPLKVNLELRFSNWMNESQIGMLSGVTAFGLDLIDNHFALILANILGQPGSRQTPEQIFGDNFVKYTHASQINISYSA